MDFYPDDTRFVLLTMDMEYMKAGDPKETFTSQLDDILEMLSRHPCTPQDIALIDACRAVKMYAQLNVPCLGIIENMSYYLCPKCGHRDELFDHGGAATAARDLDVPFLGEIPLNAKIRAYSDADTYRPC